MGTTDGRPFAVSSDVRAVCARCGKTWPVDTMSCGSCGAELGGETVIDDVHRVQTMPLGAGPGGAAASNSDTTPNAEAFAGETPTHARPPSAYKLPPFPERTDEESVTTGLLPRRANVASAPTGGSSSDPPTRFLRGVDQHIELPNGSVVDDYEIDAKLGAGAMGVVYSARHVKLGRRVAIKVIAPTMGEDPQALARFEREARALASLHHPNIVDVSTFGTLADQRSYFVMEYLVGETLDERLARGRAPLDEALDILDQMARALEGAHAQGIVHRDLKPSNTFLVRIPREQRSIVKLLDFGLAKLAVADNVEKTQSGAVLGTALYISPEQARGPNVDGRTDVYALGCVAYELVLGRHPFPEARTPTALIAAHLTETAPQPRAIWPGIPAALDLLLFSMLAKDPNYRPAPAQIRNVIASVRSPTTAAGRALRSATEPVRSVLYTRAWIAAMIVFALFLGIMIGSKVLGGTSSRGNASQISPVGISATPAEPNPRATVVVPEPAVVPVPAVDTNAAPTRAPPKPTVDPKRGYIEVMSKPAAAKVLVDNVDTGMTTPILGRALQISPGKHKITFVIGDDKFTYPVVITAGKTTSLYKELL